jgi:hypothetical protein
VVTVALLLQLKSEPRAIDTTSQWRLAQEFLEAKMQRLETDCVLARQELSRAVAEAQDLRAQLSIAVATHEEAKHRFGVEVEESPPPFLYCFETLTLHSHRKRSALTQRLSVLERAQLRPSTLKPKTQSSFIQDEDTYARELAIDRLRLELAETNDQVDTLTEALAQSQSEFDVRCTIIEFLTIRDQEWSLVLPWHRLDTSRAVFARLISGDSTNETANPIDTWGMHYLVHVLIH